MGTSYRVSLGGRQKVALPSGAFPFPLPNDYRVGRLIANFTGAFLADGDVAIATGTGTDNVPTSTNPVNRSLASAAALNANAGVYGVPFLMFNRTPLLFQAAINLSVITVVRAWVGLSNVAFTSMTAADDPAGLDFAAFRYSTAAGDTTWKCCTKGSGTMSIVDSGVPVTTAWRTFEIAFDGAAAVFKIDGLVVGSIATNLPRSSQFINQGAQLQTLEAVAKTIGIGWLYTRGKAP